MEGNKIQEQLEKSNRAKYGEKEFDQISLAYRNGKEFGDIWCSENIKRYLSRFTKPDSTKKNNLTDLYKSRDYLNRMIEENEKIENSQKVVSTEIVEDFKNDK